MSKGELHQFTPAGREAEVKPDDTPTTSSGWNAFSDWSRKLEHRAKRLARTSNPLLILGESGVGKTHLARLIHQWSPRRNRTLMEYGCGELNSSIRDSVFFGHTKGAYTGATQDRQGIFEISNGGTLILNDVDVLTLEAQGLLLRFLDDQHIHRLGDPSKPLKMDVRIIFTTNKDLEALIAKDQFRQDLYYRLKGWELKVRPLRNRQDDIIALAREFADAFELEDKPTLSPEAENYLKELDLTGNIRQLKTVVEVLLTLADPDSEISRETAQKFILDEEHPLAVPLIRESKEDLTQRIKEVLQENQGNVTETARVLGISRVTVYRHLKG